VRGAGRVGRRHRGAAGVFGEPPGSFAICPVCEWEDDNVQLADPHYQGGVNGISLADHRRGVQRKYPWFVREHCGFQPDPRWPAAEDER
jgi:Cysteine-rich CPCC